METFVYLAIAWAIDKIGIGPKWLQPPVTFCLVVMGVHSGLNGTIVDAWAYRLAGRAAGYVVDATNDPTVLIDMGGQERPNAPAELVTLVCFILTIYALLALLPDKVVKIVAHKQPSWLSFPGGKGLDVVLWCTASGIALLADVPGHFHAWNAGFLSVVLDVLPTAARIVKGIAG